MMHPWSILFDISSLARNRGTEDYIPRIQYMCKFRYLSYIYIYVCVCVCVPLLKSSRLFSFIPGYC